MVDGLSGGVVLTIRDVAWIAGLFEGEGTISHSYNRFKGTKQYRLVICMTDKDVVEKAALIWGARVTGPFYSQHGRKPRYVTRLIKKSAVRGWLLTMYSFLGTRRCDKAREVLAFL